MKWLVCSLVTIGLLSVSGCVIHEAHGGDWDHHWHGYGHAEHWDHDHDNWH